MTALCKYLSNDADSAEMALSQCLKLDPAYSDAHMLMAQISVSYTHLTLPTNREV